MLTLSVLNRVCFSFWPGIGYFVNKELLFPQQYRQVCSPYQFFTQMDGISGQPWSYLEHMLI